MLKIYTKCMYFLQVSIIAFMLSACSSLKITDEIVPSDGVQGITISKKSIYTLINYLIFFIFGTFFLTIFCFLL